MTPEIFPPGVISTADFREFSGAFTPDGKEYDFFRFADGAGMMAIELTSDGWTKPRPAPFNTEHIDNAPHITPGGRRLFFCSNRPCPGSGEGRRMTQVWFMQRQEVVESGREIRHVNFAHSDMRLGVETFKQQYRYLKAIWDGLRELKAKGASLEVTKARFTIERDFPYFKDRILKMRDVDIHQNNVEAIWETIGGK